MYAMISWWQLGQCDTWQHGQYRSKEAAVWHHMSFIALLMLSLSCWLQFDTRYFYICLHLLGILQLFKSCDPCVSILHLIHEITIYYWPTGWNKNQLKYFNHRWRKYPIIRQGFPSELRTVKYGDFFVCWNFSFFLLNLGVFVIEHCNFSWYQTILWF